MRSEGRDPALRWLLLAAVVFLAMRLPVLMADSVGVYNAHDEGLTNSDARSLVLHGTIFYDTYNPSLLMPLFTLAKAPFFKVLGVNPIGLRLPSVLALLAAMLLLALPLKRKGEELALKLFLIQLTASYFWFSHSIAGIREPILAVFCAAAAWWLERALHTRNTSDWAGAFLVCAATPLVKTSGVFMPAAFALVIAWKWIADRRSVPDRGLSAGILAACLLWVFVLLFWWLPHRAEVWEYYDLEVASRANPDVLGSFG
ncbi:MAG: glycosyltransferase family 39 protein, partial [Elusimicrobia bacterium]|nr:glycosyltransferase family 39 protein [Elusimicrobiota bacterium]